MVYVLWIMNHYNGKWLLEVVKQGALTGCGLKRETPARGARVEMRGQSPVSALCPGPVQPSPHHQDRTKLGTNVCLKYFNQSRNVPKNFISRLEF